jgi:hypothetical protein
MATATRTNAVQMKSKIKELQRFLQKEAKELKVTDAKIKQLKREQASLKQEQVSLKGRLDSLVKKLK